MITFLLGSAYIEVSGTVSPVLPFGIPIKSATAVLPSDLLAAKIGNLGSSFNQSTNVLLILGLPSASNTSPWPFLLIPSGPSVWGTIAIWSLEVIVPPETAFSAQALAVAESAFVNLIANLSIIELPQAFHFAVSPWNITSETPIVVEDVIWATASSSSLSISI